MNPNDWNSGEVRPGGTYVHAIGQYPGNWNLLAAAGNVLETGTVMQVLVPSPYVAFPDTSHRWNTDLLSIQPELTDGDSQRITYRLRPEACWNDGTPVNVEDFRYTWKVSSGLHSTACVPSTHAGYELVESVDAHDDGRTIVVRFSLGKVFPDWEAMFAYLYPAHIAALYGDLESTDGLAAAFGEFERTVPTWSAGPYQIEHAEPGTEVTLVPNPRWYGAPVPSLERVVFRVVNPTRMVEALRERTVHGVTTAQATEELVASLRGMPGVLFQLSAGLIWEHLDLNLRRGVLAPVELRRAVFTAIDRDEIIEQTVGTFVPGTEPLNSHNFLPGQPAYRDVVTATGQGKGDTAAAERILTEAGYTTRDGALIDPDGVPVAPLRFRHRLGNELHRRTGELVRAQLARIRLTVLVEGVEPVGALPAAGEHDMVVFAWAGNPVRVGPARDMWMSDGGMNYGGYSNPEVDRLLTEAAATLDLAKAHELLNLSDEIMTADAYSMPLFRKPSVLAVDERFANVRANPTNGLVIYNAQEWGLRAQSRDA